MTSIDHRHIDEGFVRPEPSIGPRTEAFWTSGADGVLRIARCEDCATWLHPPRPVCPSCRSMAIAPVAVSGRGTVHASTINRYQWSPLLDAPYVIAEVDLDDAPGVRLLTSIVECDIDAVAIGMAVEVCFARAGDAWIPLFRPATGASR